MAKDKSKVKISKKWCYLNMGNILNSNYFSLAHVYVLVERCCRHSFLNELWLCLKESLCYANSNFLVGIVLIFFQVLKSVQQECLPVQTMRYIYFALWVTSKQVFLICIIYDICKKKNILILDPFIVVNR